jgi:hypothetical protein
MTAQVGSIETVESQSRPGLDLFGFDGKYLSPA